MLVLELEPSLDALGPAQDLIAAHLEGEGVAEAVALRVRLVVEELVANLAMHATFPLGRSPVQLEIAVQAEGVELTIKDRAAPFDPRSTADPPGPPSLEEEPGGLGLPLVRRMVASLDYVTTPEGLNRTIIWFAT
jgi:anti-sigma regulatory factor (Ser/Thr protein kinase)